MIYIDILYFAAASAYNCSENNHENTYQILKSCKDIIWSEVLVYVANFQCSGISMNALGLWHSFLLSGLLVLSLFVTSAGKQERAGKGD